MAQTSSLKRKYISLSSLYISFHIHDQTLFAACPLLEKEFNKIDEKDSARILTLPSTDAELFDLFVTWLYTDTLPLPTYNPRHHKEDSTITVAVRLYIMAEELQITNLKNAICKNL
ncbi:hypothetical protein P7C71_g6483, partial [Lecanoromycetidae sp. Uapishka_2]